MDSTPNVFDCFQHLVDGTNQPLVLQALQIMGASAWSETIEWGDSVMVVIERCLLQWSLESTWAGIAAYRIATHTLCPPL